LAQKDGVTVLVVEDDALIALDIQAILEDADHKVIGLASTVEAALTIIAKEVPQIAILDVNLGKSNVFEFADVLAHAGTPILFLTGHSKAALAEAHRHRPVVAKPFLPGVLLAAMNDLRKTFK
jgi:DNA-binding response OmpR family regulator